MIPKTAEEMAAVIYMMEVQEWGVEEGAKSALKELAEASLDAAEVFFKALDRRNGPQETKGVKITRELRKKMAGMTDEERLAGVRRAMEIIKGADDTDKPSRTGPSDGNQAPP